MNIISIIAIFVLFAIALYATGINVGFELGYDEGTKLSSEWSVSGGTAYWFLGSLYSQLMLCSVGCLVSVAIRNLLISSTICFVSLTIAIRPLYHIHLQNNVYLNNAESFSQLLRDLAFLNYVCLGLCIAILGSQIVMIWRHYRNKQKIDLDAQT